MGKSKKVQLEVVMTADNSDILRKIQEMQKSQQSVEMKLGLDTKDFSAEILRLRKQLNNVSVSDSGKDSGKRTQSAQVRSNDYKFEKLSGSIEELEEELEIIRKSGKLSSESRVSADPPFMLRRQEPSEERYGIDNALSIFKNRFPILSEHSKSTSASEQKQHNRKLLEHLKGTSIVGHGLRAWLIYAQKQADVEIAGLQKALDSIDLELKSVNTSGNNRYKAHDSATSTPAQNTDENETADSSKPKYRSRLLSYPDERAEAQSSENEVEKPAPTSDKSEEQKLREELAKLENVLDFYLTVGNSDAARDITNEIADVNTQLMKVTGEYESFVQSVKNQQNQLQPPFPNLNNFNTSVSRAMDSLSSQQPTEPIAEKKIRLTIETPDGVTNLYEDGTEDFTPVTKENIATIPNQSIRKQKRLYVHKENYGHDSSVGEFVERREKLRERIKNAEEKTFNSSDYQSLSNESLAKVTELRQLLEGIRKEQEHDESHGLSISAKSFKEAGNKIEETLRVFFDKVSKNIRDTALRQEKNDKLGEKDLSDPEIVEEKLAKIQEIIETLSESRATLYNQKAPQSALGTLDDAVEKLLTKQGEIEEKARKKQEAKETPEVTETPQEESPADTATDEFEKFKDIEAKWLEELIQMTEATEMRNKKIRQLFTWTSYNDDNSDAFKRELNAEKKRVTLNRDMTEDRKKAYLVAIQEKEDSLRSEGKIHGTMSQLPTAKSGGGNGGGSGNSNRFSFNGRNIVQGIGNAARAVAQCNVSVGSLAGLASKAANALGALGPIGVAIGGAIATSIGVAVATIVKMNQRLNEAANVRRTFNELNNEAKLLSARMMTLGYVSDDMVSQFIDLQVQAEKTAWANRFLTEEDKKVEEAVTGMKIGMRATIGTLADFAMAFVADLFPNMQTVVAFLQDEVAPILSATSTVIQNWSEVWDYAITSVASTLMNGIGSIQSFAENTMQAVVNLGKNIGTWASNLANNIVVWIRETFSNLGTDISVGINNIWTDLSTIFDNVLSNIGEFVSAFIKNFGKIPELLLTVGSNIITVMGNIGGAIKTFFSNLGSVFTWENLKKAWKTGDISGIFADTMKGIDLTQGTKEVDFGKLVEGADFKDVMEGTERRDKDGNLRAGYRDADEEKTANKEEREKNGWVYRDLNQDMVKWNDGFSDTNYFKELGGELRDEADSKLQKIMPKYEENLAKVNRVMGKNVAQETEKEYPTVNFGPWQQLQTLMGSRSNASTESLSSAYDRINSAVANRNPVVEAIQKQMDAEKQFQTETKEMDKKSLEYQEKSKQHNETVQENLSNILGFLKTYAPAYAAVVEG